jgi:hypothetical protein
MGRGVSKNGERGKQEWTHRQAIMGRGLITDGSAAVLGKCHFCSMYTSVLSGNKQRTRWILMHQQSNADKEPQGPFSL